MTATVLRDPPWPPPGDYFMEDYLAEMERVSGDGETVRRIRWGVYFHLGTLRYSHPRPLAIDGDAYRRRTRRRKP